MDFCTKDSFPKHNIGGKEVWLSIQRSRYGFNEIKTKIKMHRIILATFQFPTGSLTMTFVNILYEKLSIHDILLKQYQEFKGERYFGTYWPISGQPILTLRDMDLVQHMMGKHNKTKLYVLSVLP